MSFFGKFFGRKNRVQDFIEAKPPQKQTGEARDDFYENLRAQESQRAESLVLGDDEMSAEEAMAFARKIVQHDPASEMTVVRQGVDDGLVDTQDAAPAGQVFTPNRDGKFADIWSTFAKINPRILRHFVSRAFIGYPACTILGTHEFINPCCAMPGEDAIAPGYTVECVSDVHKQNDEHIMAETLWRTKLLDVAEKMGMNTSCTKLSFHTRLYGIGVAVPRVRLKEGHTMEEPYDVNLIEPGSYRGFSIVDPQRYTWDMSEDSLYDPLSEYYMAPEFIRLYNNDQRIHRSWLVVSIFKEVGDDLKGTYMWGGVPLSQMLYERVFCADKLANEIVALAMSKRTVVKDGNMKAMIAEPGKTNHFIERWNGFRNNSCIAFKEPGEQIQQLETSLADLQPLSAQQYQYAAAIAGIPVTKLLKNVPSGLQATGQYEQDEYEQTLKGIQVQCFKPLLEKHFDLYIASEYPDRKDLDVVVRFNPITLPKVTEVSQMAQARAGMVNSLLQSNTITVTEARAILKEGDSPVFSMLENKTPELLTKIESMKDPEKQQEMQMKAQQAAMGGMGGGMPGMGGAAPGAGGQGGQPENPEFTQNKDIFQQAIQEVEGGENGEGQEGQGESNEANPPPANAPEGEANGSNSGDNATGEGDGGQSEEDGPFAMAMKKLG